MKTTEKNPSPNPAGRPKGTPNKATMNAREAISAFVDDNAERLTEWLDTIAKGIEHPDGGNKYLVYPDPDGAFKAFMSVVEYHIPKLARHTHEGGDPDKPINLSATVKFVD